MRPYLAIIKDSFREALASRVLWTMLVLITLMLIGLCPFTWRGTVAPKLTFSDIISHRTFVDRIREGSAEDATAAQSHLWRHLSESTQNDMQEFKDDRRRTFGLINDVIEDLNSAITTPDFFQPEAWKDIEFNKRTQSLIEKPQRTPQETEVLNRLVIEAAIPGQLRRCPREAMAFRYLHWELTNDFFPPLDRDVAEAALDDTLLTFISLLAGRFGILAAILVTASIVPNMLDSGSLYLLLSKPISRAKLFVAKFIGGCSFVFILGAYLIAGIWLIVGIRFGLWKPQFLWAIPIFLFSFAIFYSVSALSGLIWRSTIMCVAMTILFWLMCFVLGVTKGAMEGFLILPEKITRVIPAGDELLILRANGGAHRWDRATNEWQPTFKSEKNAPRMMGPPGMMPQNRLMGPLFIGDKKLLVAIEPKWPQPQILVGRPEEDWARTELAAGPRNTRAIFLHNDRPIVVADQGVYELFLDSEPQGEGSNIFGLKIPKPTRGAFGRISTGSESFFRGEMLTAFDKSRSLLYVFNIDSLRRFGLNETANFAEQRAMNVEVEKASQLAANAAGVCITTRKGHVVFFDESFQELARFQPEQDTPVRQVVAAPTASWFAVLFENDRLWIYDQQEKKQLTRISGQGAITGISVNDDNELLVGDISDRVSVYGVPELSQLRRFDANQPILRKLYRYVVSPVHGIFPKPAELDNTMRYFVTGKDTMTLGGGAEEATVKLDPWQPLKSNLIFITVMLVVGCIYVYRQDF